MLFNFYNILPIKFLYTDFKFSFIYKIHYKDLLIILFYLKNHQNLRFNILSTISCTDYPEINLRFELTYILMSLDFPFLLHLKINISEFTELNSSSIYFKSAVWLEREIWDMFGLYFINNFDLRRILTDYGFPYHPLRKTFPLQGFFQVYYNFIKKKVYYINLITSQVKNNKFLNSTWNYIC